MRTYFIKPIHPFNTAALYSNPDKKGKDAEDEIYDLTQFLYPELE
jgi:hypothetical protein